MISDEPYDKAYAFQKTELWNTLYDMDMFAVRMDDGETGYCNVMGMRGEHFALSLYLGDSGLESYYTIMSSSGEEDMTEADYAELLYSQDCIQCSFETKQDMFPDELTWIKAYAEKRGLSFRGRGRKYVHFARFKPGYAPWYIQDEKEISYIQQALDAALEVADRIQKSSKREAGFLECDADGKIPLLSKNKKGFVWETMQLPEEVSVEKSSPVLNEDAVKALSVLKRAVSLECKFFKIPYPIQKDKDEAPCLPGMLVSADSQSGMLFEPSGIITPPEEEAQTLDAFIQFCIDKEFLPEKIHAADGRTARILQDFCTRTGTPMIIGKTKFIEDACDSMVQYMGGQGMVF